MIFIFLSNYYELKKNTEKKHCFKKRNMIVTRHICKPNFRSKILELTVTEETPCSSNSKMWFAFFVHSILPQYYRRFRQFWFYLKELKSERNSQYLL